jgi:hypothetical protein
MANKKISQLTGATTPLTGTEELAIVQGGSTVKATAQDVADLGGGLPYLVYTAILTQTGTTAPVATVLENTFNETFSITRPTSTGNYNIESVNSSFTTGKTFVILQSMTSFTSGNIVFNQVFSISSSSIIIRTYNTSFAPAEATFANPNIFSIEIRVYP